MFRNLVYCLREYNTLSKADQRLVDFLLFVWSYLMALGIIVVAVLAQRYC